MFSRAIYSFPLSVLISSLHIGCCILPLFSVAVGSSSYFQILNQYKSLITTFQIVLLVYVLVNLYTHYKGIRSIHGRWGLLSNHLSLIIVAAGLWIGYFEPFKSENQRLAQQQFELFQTHRQATLRIPGGFDQTQLREDLLKVKGVKPKRISFDNDAVLLTYSNQLTSRQQIVTYLQKRGYSVAPDQQ